MRECPGDSFWTKYRPWVPPATAINHALDFAGPAYDCPVFGCCQSIRTLGALAIPGNSVTHLAFTTQNHNGGKCSGGQLDQFRLLKNQSPGPSLIQHSSSNLQHDLYRPSGIGHRSVPRLCKENTGATRPPAWSVSGEHRRRRTLRSSADLQPSIQRNVASFAQMSPILNLPDTPPRKEPT